MTRRSKNEDPGPGVDASGNPADDPTSNVLQLVDAAIRRQDDLRKLESQNVHMIMEIRASYEDKLRIAETARIDAIRAVDVGNVQRAAEAQAAQQSILAAQVVASAEALRITLAATQAASEITLRTTIQPINDRLADLTRAQYEAQGVKAQTGDARLNLGAVLGAISVFLVFIFGMASIAIALIAN